MGGGKNMSALISGELPKLAHYYVGMSEKLVVARGRWVWLSRCPSKSERVFADSLARSFDNLSLLFPSLTNHASPPCHLGEQLSDKTIQQDCKIIKRNERKRENKRNEIFKRWLVFRSAEIADYSAIHQVMRGPTLITSCCRDGMWLYWLGQKWI